MREKEPSAERITKEEKASGMVGSGQYALRLGEGWMAADILE